MTLEHFLAELTCGDDGRAEGAVRKISGIPLQQIQPFMQSLQAQLSSPSEDRRWWAVRALAEISDPRVPGWLAERLSDPDAGVRQCAALGLRQQPDAQAVLSLVEALHDRDPLVARLAGEALAAAGEPAVLPLIEVLQGNSRVPDTAAPHARREAARALAAIGDPRAVPALYEILDDDSALLVYWAEQGLERMGVGMVFFKP
jgi:HEAT repeat protein